MSKSTMNKIRAAEKSVNRLVEECHKPGRLYARNPKAVAQVSRTGKWLLNAISALHKVLGATEAEDKEQAS
jgi:hypothetical protein